MGKPVTAGFSKNGIELKAGAWYLAKRDGDSNLHAWHCQQAFRLDKAPKLLRSPARLTWDSENGKLVRHSPSPYDYDYAFHIERELTEAEAAGMYGLTIPIYR